MWGDSGWEVGWKSWVIHNCGELFVVDTQENHEFFEANGPPLAFYLELDPSRQRSHAYALSASKVLNT